MTKVVNIDNAIVDTEKFRSYNDRAQQILEEIELLQDDFKELVATIAKETKLEKKEVSGYFKAKKKAKIKEAVKKGELYDALDAVLED